MVTQSITLNQLYTAAHPQVRAVQGDTARQLEMIIADRTVASGATGALSFERSDKTFYQVSAALSQVNNSFISDITQALTQPGVTKCQLKVTESSKIVSSYTFEILVEKNTTGEASSQDYYTITQALDTAEDALETAEAAVDGALEYAQGVAADVLETAQSAVTTAESAVGISETAMEEAEDARDFVQGIVSELAPSIKSDALSGDIVTFDNGADNWPVNECIISVDAVQDLHGYDAPWPAGGGKNKFQTTQGNGTTSGVTFTVNSDGTVSTSGTATAAIYRIIGSFFAESGVQYVLTGTPSSGGVEKFRMTFGGVGYDYGSGLSFTGDGASHNISCDVYTGYGDGLVFKPMIRLATESDATFAPYENNCPISGWSSAKVTRTGKNLLINPKNSYSANNVTYTKNFDGSISVSTSGTASANTFYEMDISGRMLYKGGTYKVVVEGMPTGMIFQAYEVRSVGASKTYKTNLTGDGTTKTGTFTFRDISYFNGIRIYVTSGSTVNATVKIGLYTSDNTDPTYEPYKGRTFTIDLDGTNYGCKLDVTRGKMVVDTICVETDLSTATYTEATNTKFFQRNVFPSGSEVVGGSGAVGNSKYKCSIAPYAYDIKDYVHWYASSNSRQIRCYVPKDLDVTGMTAQFMGVLKTPIEVDLTPTEVSTILGLNHVWADCGTIERLVLTEDTKGYVDNDKYSKAPVITDTATGAIASFSDGADGYPLKECVVDVDAVQDLHGYDNPWPAGGGVNKINLEGAVGNPNKPYGFEISVNASTGFITINGTPTTSGNYSFAVILADSLPYVPVIIRTYDRNTQATNVNLSARWLEDSGGIAVDLFNVVANTSYNLTFRVVGYEGSTAPTSWSPYSNICPISGWSSAKVTRTGKNILQNDLPESTVSTTGWTILTDKNTGVMTVSGTGDGTNNPFFYLVGTLSTYPLLIKAGSYVLSQGAVLPLNCMLRITTSSTTIAQCQNVDSVAFTLANDTYVNVYLRLDKSASITTPVKIYPMIRLASDTDPTFAPYNGTTFTISLGDTRYGAMLDVTRGKLRVTHRYVDLGSWGWKRYAAGSTYQYRWMSSGHSDVGGTIIGYNCICSNYATTNWEGVTNGRTNNVIASEGRGNVSFIDSTMDNFTPEQVKTALSGAQLVYELATPIEIDLTPTEITTLLGINNIWADTGDVSVDYCADTKLYLNKKIAEVQALVLQG